MYLKGKNVLLEFLQDQHPIQNPGFKLSIPWSGDRTQIFSCTSQFLVSPSR